MLSLVVPGAGQLYIGRVRTGLNLLVAAIVVTACIVYSAGQFGGRHLVLIVYLCLSLPVIYFYSVYDILQATTAGRGGSGAAPGAEGAALETGERDRISRSQGVGLIAAGALLLLLIRPAEWAERWLGLAGDYAAAAGLVVIAAILYGRRGTAMYRLGRATAAVVLIATGCLLLWDRMKGGDGVALIGQWWPVALIALGVEVVAFSIGYRKSGKRLAFDTGGLLLAAVVAFGAYGVTQLNGFPMKWIDQWTAEVSELSGFTEEKGFRYAKEPVEHELDSATRSLLIDNPNGRVTLREGDVERIVVEAEVWIDVEEQAEADRIAEQAAVAISGEEKLTIAAEAENYGAAGNRKPRMNMIVTLPRSPEPIEVEVESAPEMPETGAESPESAGLPEQPEASAASGTPDAPVMAEQEEQAYAAQSVSSADQANGEAEVDGGEETGAPNLPEQPGETDASTALPESQKEEEPLGLRTITINALNGDVDVRDIRVLDTVEIDNANGGVVLRNIAASVKASTKNGGVEAYDIAGDAKLTTFNGVIAGERIGGDALATTTNGSVKLIAIGGSVEADTKNGEIDIMQVQGSVHADTLNGRIGISSPVVGGHWDIGSAVGEIYAALPEDGDYSVRGSVTFGDIATDLPLEVGKKTIEGEIGEGTYRISIDANSSIVVNRYQPSPPPSN